MRAVKVLFDHDTPYFLAHGGFQIQIDQTLAALRANGVDAEPLRWWDETQRPDIIHYFTRPLPNEVDAAKAKGIKIIVAQLFTGVGSRPPWKLALQGMAFGLGRKLLRGEARFRLGWDAFLKADACVALTPFEGRLLTSIYGVEPERVHIVPNGIEEAFLQSAPTERGQWLICTATITERKRVVELAEAAIAANTPVWIIGKPYADSDPYAQRFFALAKANPKIIRFEGAISDRAKLAQAYRAARGFVLLSDRESLSLSALEAAACECPLLLSDLPWARETFGEAAQYCPIAGASRTAQALRAFYDQAPQLKAPPKPVSWHAIGAQLKSLYETLLSASR
jgi:glycosyltransferase involved in cell wall biosynthesis